MYRDVRNQLGAVFAVTLMAIQPAVSQDVELAPNVAAGKLLFEETAGGVGCASCHDLDAAGGDVGTDIRGTSPAMILMKLRVVADMRFIELTREEVDQVAAYLAHLRAEYLRARSR